MPKRSKTLKRLFHPEGKGQRAEDHNGEDSKIVALEGKKRNKWGQNQDSLTTKRKKKLWGTMPGHDALESQTR